MQRNTQIAASLALLSAPLTTFAGWAPVANNSGTPNDLTLVVTNVINWILGFIGLVAVLIIIWGGVQYLTSTGNQDTVKRAKDTIKTGLMGLIIAGIAYAIVNLIIGTVLRA